MISRPFQPQKFCDSVKFHAFHDRLSQSTLHCAMATGTQRRLILRLLQDAKTQHPAAHRALHAPACPGSRCCCAQRAVLQGCCSAVCSLQSVHPGRSILSHLITTKVWGRRAEKSSLYFLSLQNGLMNLSIPEHLLRPKQCLYR